MVRIEVSDKENLNKNLLYIQNTLSEVFRQTGTKVSLNVFMGRAILNIDCEDFYYPLILSEVYDKIADIIAIGYKYYFLAPLLKPVGLSKKETDFLLTAIIGADYPDDKRYILSKLNGIDNPSIDGIFNFKLKLLKEKWTEIACFMPKTFDYLKLKDFINYLIVDKNDKIFVENGKVYDTHYRQILRADLTPLDKKHKLINEIILSLPGEIELRGSIDNEDENFLKELFGSKIIFKMR